MARLHPVAYEHFYNELSCLTGISKNEIDMFILKIVKVTVNNLHRDGKVCLPYFGKFSLRRVPARKRVYNDIHTHESVTLHEPAQDKLKFKINGKFSKLFK